MPLNYANVLMALALRVRASAGQFHLFRKLVEIRTRNCLRPERLAFLNRIGWVSGTESATG